MSYRLLITQNNNDVLHALYTFSPSGMDPVLLYCNLVLDTVLCS